MKSSLNFSNLLIIFLDRIQRISFPFQTKIKKTDVGLDIDVLEAAASLAVEQDKQTNQISEDISNLTVSSKEASACSGPSKATILDSTFEQLSMGEREPKKI